MVRDNGVGDDDLGWLWRARGGDNGGEQEVVMLVGTVSDNGEQETVRVVMLGWGGGCGGGQGEVMGMKR